MWSSDADFPSLSCVRISRQICTTTDVSWSLETSEFRQDYLAWSHGISVKLDVLPPFFGKRYIFVRDMCEVVLESDPHLRGICCANDAQPPTTREALHAHGSTRRFVVLGNLRAGLMVSGLRAVEGIFRVCRADAIARAMEAAQPTPIRSRYDKEF